MRSLVIVAVTFVAGCGVNRAQYSQDAPWVQRAKHALSRVDQHYPKWEAARKDPNVFGSEHYWGVKHGIWDLWILTGHCLFGDICCDELVPNAPKISKRYRQFIRERGKTPLAELLLEGLAMSINMIRTEYCLPALSILQKKVDFENEVHIAGYPKCLKVHPDLRTKAYEGMREWFGENKERLVWDPFFAVFRRDSVWALRSFKLPDPVFEAFKSMFDGSNVWTTPCGDPASRN